MRRWNLRRRRVSTLRLHTGLFERSLGRHGYFDRAELGEWLCGGSRGLQRTTARRAPSDEVGRCRVWRAPLSSVARANERSTRLRTQSARYFAAIPSVLEHAGCDWGRTFRWSDR